MAHTVMDDLESLTHSSSTAQAPAALQARPSAPSPLGATVQKIVKDCGLTDVLGQSVCLRCATRVLAMDANKRATLYCSALFRDLEVPIVACTAFSPELPEASTP